LPQTARLLRSALVKHTGRFICLCLIMFFYSCHTESSCETDVNWFIAVLPFSVRGKSYTGCGLFLGWCDSAGWCFFSFRYTATSSYNHHWTTSLIKQGPTL